MSDVHNQNAQSHFAMEEQFAADMAPPTAVKSAKIFLMFSLIAFGAIGGYVNANWESYKDMLSFSTASSDEDVKPCCSTKRLPPPDAVLYASSQSDACPISGKQASCCSHKDELAAATGGEAPCCSQMNKAIVAAMLEVATKSDATDQQEAKSEVAAESAPAPAPAEEI